MMVVYKVCAICLQEVQISERLCKIVFVLFYSSNFEYQSQCLGKCKKEYPFKTMSVDIVIDEFELKIRTIHETKKTNN